MYFFLSVAFDVTPYDSLYYTYLVKKRTKVQVNKILHFTICYNFSIEKNDK